MRIEILRIQTYLLNRLTNYLYKNSFVWVLPVILSKSTDPLYPDPSGSVEKTLEVEVYGQKLSLMQSMIVHKQYLISEGIERLFILSPNIRIEKAERANSGKHLFEFTQLDLEMAYTNDVEARRFIEKMIFNAVRYVRVDMNLEMKVLDSSFAIPKIPFKEFKYLELKKEYGEEWERYLIETINSPVWVTGIPRYFYDMEDENGEWRNYDLYVPNYGEILSGGQREYQYNKILEKMKRDNININKYSKLLELAELNKLKPSAGAGLGIERFVMWVTEVNNIKEVQPFPRVPGENIEL